MPSSDVYSQKVQGICSNRIQHVADRARDAFRERPHDRCVEKTATPAHMEIDEQVDLKILGPFVERSTGKHHPEAQLVPANSIGIEGSFEKGLLK